jgi:hypothetical protein
MSTTPARQPQGVPVGGQFATMAHPESDLDLSDEPAAQSEPPLYDPAAPLSSFKVIGVEEKVFRAAPDAPRQPGGTCWHCGTGITICVLAQHAKTKEVVTIGTTCAERIGLDPDGLKRYLRERREQRRAERWAADQEAREKALAEKEAELAGRIGPHGTVSRFTYGCRCDECVAVAPHGTPEHFYGKECSCKKCVEATLAADRSLSVVTQAVLVDASTGQVIDDARVVSGKYGSSWVIPSRDEFVPYGRKQRKTVLARGYLYAEAEYIVRRGQRGSFPIRRMSTPETDEWGEPIIVADQPNSADPPPSHQV